ncbi:MAG: type II secretion system protein [Phycisphaerae bacterium]|nr:type II secretion system protein [Phycisphaerae bacterium]
MTKRRGFTLIELLVVIAIIALLMSILMPALAKVRDQAKTLGCASNLRQWNLTFAMYVEDSAGKFPSGTSAEGFWWVNQMPARMLNWRENKIWFCPTATKPVVNIDGTSNQRFNNYSAWGVFADTYAGPQGIAGSYGLNGYVLSTKPGTTFEGGRRTDDNWRTPQVQGANNIPLFADALRFDAWPIWQDQPPQTEDMAWQGTNHMTRFCVNRHSGFINSAFCDFSVRKVGLKELWILKWHRTYNTNTASPVWPTWMAKFKDYSTD